MRFALGVLATWRVTHLLSSEDGPADLLAHLRARLGSGLAGRLMDCFECLSIWVAVPVSLLVCRGSADRLLTWLALSGAACLLERGHGEPVVIQSIPEIRNEDKNNGMLRSEA